MKTSTASHQTYVCLQGNLCLQGKRSATRDLLLESAVCSLQTVAEQYLVLCWSGSLGSELRVPVSVKT